MRTCSSLCSKTLVISSNSLASAALITIFSRMVRIVAQNPMRCAVMVSNITLHPCSRWVTAIPVGFKGVVKVNRNMHGCLS